LVESTRQKGSDINISDANTINGQPGDLLPCSRNDTFRTLVEHGKTYLLRIINAGLTYEVYFAVAGHNLTVVGTDGRYLRPFTVDTIMVAPGQTFNVLLKADQTGNNSRYYMAARTLMTQTNAVNIPVDNTTATAILEYDTEDASRSKGQGRERRAPDLPNLPAVLDEGVGTAFVAQLRSLVTKEHPVDVPMHVDEHMFITVSVNLFPCRAAGGKNCTGPDGQRLAASLNNVSFADPRIDILDAYHSSIHGVYEPNFPDKPPSFFNFSDESIPLNASFTEPGTRVKVVEYGTVLEVVLQDTGLLALMHHPIHLHGFSFYVVGSGFGIFDKDKDPATYNLVDPPYQNTVTVPKSGWTTIRFRAANPGKNSFTTFIICYSFQINSIIIYIC
jgi:laccase